jgi:ferredoxin--NADP+ reductase
MALSVAIVGAGPAAFYTADALLEQVPVIAIDLIERLATPYGLIRAGVAPDHQTTKQVTRKFEPVGLDQSVRFYGNVEVGRDIDIADLRAAYDAVVLAVGSPLDRALGIPGEQRQGVYGASAFVGWYNGHPDFRDLNPLIAPRVVVVGNGNVALDVARVLVKTPAELAASDMPDYAALAIERAAVEHVTIVGRRGPAAIKFSPAELREVAALAGCAPVIDRAVLEAARPQVADAKGQGKAFAILQELAAADPAGRRKRLEFVFFAAPAEILGGDAVTGLRIGRTRLEDGQAVPTGETMDLACGTVVAAIGYRASPIDGVPFDPARGLFPSDNGRIEHGLYAVGWAKRGPTGIIASNRPDGALCAQQIALDYPAAEGSAVRRPGRAMLERLLQERGARPVTFDDWQRIDAAEIARGRHPAPRRKFTTLEDMLAVLAEPAGPPGNSASEG